MKKQFRKGDIIIVFLSILLLFSVIYVEKDKKLIKDKWYKEKYEAALIMERALLEIKEEKIRRNIEIDLKYDINATGIIGVEFNGITTTLGALEAKRTSANPDFAAIMVDLIKDAGLEEGANVAINFSSSFPALNIGVISACEVLGLNPIIISSIGSSTWGGNNLEFTYLDMEEFLFQKGVIHNKSKAISPGGARDMGRDMKQGDLGIILDRMNEYNKEIILEEQLGKNVEIRYNLYYEDIEEINMFINVGGNIVAFGNTMDSLNLFPGLIKEKKFNLSNDSGLVQLFNSKGIPIIHILNIKDLAHRYGVEIDPNRPFMIGESDVYYIYKYPSLLILLIIMITIIFLNIFKKRTKTKYD